RELAGEAGMPGAQSLRRCDEAAELGDGVRGRRDLARREQRLAPVEREIGARRVVGLEPGDRPPEQPGGARDVVARERAATRRAEPRRRALAERAAPRVERIDLEAVLVRLLEMEADRLVVLDRLAGAALDPVGEALVQLGARLLEQPPV